MSSARNSVCFARPSSKSQLSLKLEQAYTTRRDKIVSGLAKIVGPADAEDALNAGFLGCLKAIHSPAREKDVKDVPAWLWMASRNEAFRFLKHRRRMASMDPTVAQVLPAREPSAEETGLPPDIEVLAAKETGPTRDILLMLAAGLKFNEIAPRVAKTPNNCRQILWRFKRRFKQ